MFSSVAINTATKTHYSYNLLLEHYRGTNGMKTGFVCASGYNIAASATRNGRTLVAVVLGRSSQTDRATFTAKLLTQGFSQAGSGSVFAPVETGAPAVNMRPQLCSPEARAARYDPVAGTATLTSPHLDKRVRSSQILEIRPGDIDGPPSTASLVRILKSLKSIAVPERRPNFDVASGKIILPAIGVPATNNLAIPTARPRS